MNTESKQLNQSGFSTESINWFQLDAGHDFGYPIDYWMAILGTHVEQKKVDFLVKWTGATHCHFHRHVADTTSLVLEGEHHVLDGSDPTGQYAIRGVGHFSQTTAGDMHMERGGPNGAVVLFSMHSSDGRLFEILDSNERIINTVTVDHFATGSLR